MSATIQHATRTPKDTQELQRAQQAVSRFVRSLQVLLRAARLYQKNHPHVMESLEAADKDLRSALDRVAPLEIRVERGHVVFRGQAIADSRGELKTLAEHILHRGISTLVFHSETHLGELGTVAQLLGNTPLHPGDDEPADWRALLAENHVHGIRVNEPLEEKKADSVLTTLLAAVLAPDLASSAMEATAAQHVEHVEAATIQELAGVLQLLARIAAPLRRQEKVSPQEVVAALRDAIAGTDRRGVMLLGTAMTDHHPKDGENIEPYFSRLGEALALEFATQQFRSSRTRAPQVRDLFLKLAREMDAAGGLRPARHGSKWTDESYAEYLLEHFWAELPAREKAEALRSTDAWCVPVPTLRPYLDQLAGAGGARQARFILLNYAQCLHSDESPTRLAVATGLSEMGPLIATLWPQQTPEELTRAVTRALIAETAPEVAGVLASVVDHLALLALDRNDFGELEAILLMLENAAPTAGGRNSLLTTLAQRMLGSGNWQKLVGVSLEHRPLDASLPRILGRDPERLLDSLNALLAAPKGLDLLAPMARLLRAIGEPVVGALVTRLFDPRTQRATSAVKLLANTRPDRLVDALPRALPGWDWNLQDMAVGELTRMGIPGAALAFLDAIPHAHSLVVPMMIDEIGLAGESEAVPLLMEIAAGQNEHINDVFVRIKSVEALGRLRALEAGPLLRAILRQRYGLTHAEPAGLRAAAEEALGLIENRPSSARVRTVQQAAEKASVSFTRPRRYLRVPLDSPLTARIWTPEGSARREAAATFNGPSVPAKVKTISLGGAFVESGQRMNVGDSCAVEIRSGLRRIQGTAVVRNVSPEGGGVEFVHMKQEDRERLRKLVNRLLST